MKPVPYASTLRRDYWPEQTVGEGAGYAGFVAACVWAIVTFALNQWRDTGQILAVIDIGALPAGMVAVLMAGSAWRATRGGAVWFALIALVVGAWLFCLSGALGFAIVAGGWVAVMFWFVIGTLMFAPLAHENPRKRRARRWPHYAQHARRPR